VDTALCVRRVWQVVVLIDRLNCWLLCEWICWMPVACKNRFVETCTARRHQNSVVVSWLWFAVVSSLLDFAVLTCVCVCVLWLTLLLLLSEATHGAFFIVTSDFQSVIDRQLCTVCVPWWMWCFYCMSAHDRYKPCCQMYRQYPIVNIHVMLLLINSVLGCTANVSFSQAWSFPSAAHHSCLMLNYTEACMCEMWATCPWRWMTRCCHKS